MDYELDLLGSGLQLCVRSVMPSKHPREMQEIIKGLVIGVGAGVTTAAILGVYRWLIRYRDRREQIPYIRDLISNQMGRILSASDLPPPELGMEPIPADRVRFVFFRELQSALLVALSSRATALNYQEVSSL